MTGLRTSQCRGVNLVAGSRLLRSGHAISVYHHLVILRCTRKLLRLLGTETAADPRPMPGTGDWYANLLWFDRRKCLLLTHAGTLFPSSRPTCAPPTFATPTAS